MCSVAQVTVCGQSAEGLGPSKKVAKRNAAEKMLDLLGYKVPQPQPQNRHLKLTRRYSQTSNKQVMVDLHVLTMFCNM